MSDTHNHSAKWIIALSDFKSNCIFTFLTCTQSPYVYQDCVLDVYCAAYESAKQRHLLIVLKEMDIFASTELATDLMPGVGCEALALDAMMSNEPKQ